MRGPTTKDQIMDFVRVEKSGGPVFRTVVADQGPIFHRDASTIDARARELRQAGFLSQQPMTMSGHKQKIVAYTCSAEQYHAWLMTRGKQAAAVKPRGSDSRGGQGIPPEPTAKRSETSGSLFDIGHARTHHGEAVGGRR